MHSMTVADDVQTLDGLIALLERHERDGRGHARRVARLTMVLADALGACTNGQRLVLEHGALLHDIGKLRIPSAILLKSAPLDTEEWQVMRRHPQLGYDLLVTLPEFADGAGIVLSHHEAFDGGGYPHGLKGAEIPIGARILAVADSYDSMTHPHIQRPAMPSALAVSEIARCRGSQFDPDIVDALGTVLADAAEDQAS